MPRDQHSLTDSERSFCEDVAQMVYTNPFGPERSALEDSLASCAATSPGEQTSTRAIRAALEKVQSMQDEGRANIQHYSGEDRRIVTYLLLFAMYHRLLREMENHIEKQSQTPDSILEFLPARKAIEWMIQWGFEKHNAYTFLSLAFQLKRAHYFIGRTLVGDSTSMARLRTGLWQNIFTNDVRLYESTLKDRMEDFSTLILGQTGSGKGAVAAALGRAGFIPYDAKMDRFSENFASSFISINLSQYPENLIESELFGHKKGAFTGAIDRHQGVFSRSSRYGALFLDEIGDASLPIQCKLLQVLQERQYSPVGSHARERFNGRIIAATNKDIDQLRHDGSFRDDFYYRLCSDLIQVPTLHQRFQENPDEQEDMICHVTQSILGEECPELVDIVSSRIASSVPKDYSWPGNVRELEQCVRSILLTERYTPQELTQKDDLLGRLKQSVQTGSYTAQGLLSDYCKLLHERHNTYEEVARRTGLDRRTVKKHIEQAN